LYGFTFILVVVYLFFSSSVGPEMFAFSPIKTKSFTKALVYMYSIF